MFFKPFFLARIVILYKEEKYISFIHIIIKKIYKFLINVMNIFLIESFVFHLVLYCLTVKFDVYMITQFHFRWFGYKEIRVISKFHAEFLFFLLEVESNNIFKKRNISKIFFTSYTGCSLRYVRKFWAEKIFSQA